MLPEQSICYFYRFRCHSNVYLFDVSKIVDTPGVLLHDGLFYLTVAYVIVKC